MSTDATSDPTGRAGVPADGGGRLHVPGGPWTSASRRTRRVDPRVPVAVVDGVAVLAAAWAAAGSLASIGHAVGALLLVGIAGGYRRHLTPRTAEAMGGLLRPLLVLGAVVAMAGHELGDADVVRQALLTPVLVMAGRLVSGAGLTRLRRAGAFRRRALVIGGGVVAGEIIDALEADPSYGLDVVAVLDGATGCGAATRPGGRTDLEALVAEHRISTVIVAFSSTREHELVDAVRAAAASGVDVYVVPRFFDVGMPVTGEAVDSVFGIPLYRVTSALRRRVRRRVKRAFDVSVAAAIGLLVLPMVLLVAAAVRLTSVGPVLYRQGRIGENGREFELLKFRTLHLEACSDTEWSTSDRDTQTAVGRILRRTNLDELPQLWNIIRGDMSLIGPRPERSHFVSSFWDSVDGYPARHRMPAGVTGWAQVHGLRGDERIAERARFDNRYIEHWSLWRDVVILARTPSALRKPSP